MNHCSTETRESQVIEGVSFTIRRMSFGRRLRLLASVRDLTTRLEAAKGGDSVLDKIEACTCEAEMQALYIEWGLVAVRGLTIDGGEPTAAALIEAGPENLCGEIAEAVRRECFLTPDERKN